MRKISEVNNPDSCLNKAAELEMVFVLRGKDECSPATIRFWVSERLRLGKNKATDLKIIFALEDADSMERERA